MEYRKLGRSGLKVSEIALGSWLTYGQTVDEEAATQIIHKAFELGINLFDTANVYAAGAAEKIVGKALRELPRDEYVLATKCFFPMGPKPNQSGLSRKHIHDQAEASLRRLGLDYIDLYQAHRFDNDTPLDETLRAFDDLVRAGKVRYVGVSSWMANQMIEAHAVAERLMLDQIVSHQPMYNMFNRSIEKDIIPTCETLGIGQIVYGPLAQGTLTGKYAGGKIPQGSRASEPEKQGKFMAKYLTEENHKRVEYLRPIAAELDMTMAQLALAWCLRQENLSAVICGATKPTQIEDNSAAAGKKIPPDTLNRIDEILS